MKKVQKNKQIVEAINPSAMAGVKAGNYLIDRFYEDEMRDFERFDFSYPRTKLKDLLDYYKSIKAEENVYYARIDAGLNPQKVLEHLEARRAIIELQYERHIHQEDNYLFDTLNELGFFLRKTLFFSEENIFNSLKHEERHFRELVGRDYKQSRFGCWLCLNEKDKPEYITRVQIPLRRPMKKNDYRAITKANRKGSCIDDLCKF